MRLHPARVLLQNQATMKENKGLMSRVLYLIQIQRSLKNVVQALARLLIVDTEAMCTTELAHIVFDGTEFCLN
jgi:hypothetical protein